MAAAAAAEAEAAAEAAAAVGGRWLPRPGRSPRCSAWPARPPPISWRCQRWGRQGLTFVHFLAHRKRFSWDTPRVVSDKRLRLSSKVDECKPLGEGNIRGAGAHAIRGAAGERRRRRLFSSLG